VTYKSGFSVVSAGEIDEVFVRQVGELMKEICGEREPHKAPSYGECLHCPLTPEDCSDRGRRTRGRRTSSRPEPNGGMEAPSNTEHRRYPRRQIW
jgi:hypothetical protein